MLDANGYKADGNSAVRITRHIQDFAAGTFAHTVRVGTFFESLCIVLYIFCNYVNLLTHFVTKQHPRFCSWYICSHWELVHFLQFPTISATVYIFCNRVHILQLCTFSATVYIFCNSVHFLQLCTFSATVWIFPYIFCNYVHFLAYFLTTNIQDSASDTFAHTLKARTFSAIVHIFCICVQCLVLYISCNYVHFLTHFLTQQHARFCSWHICWYSARQSHVIESSWSASWRLRISFSGRQVAQFLKSLP